MTQPLVTTGHALRFALAIAATVCLGCQSDGPAMTSDDGGVEASPGDHDAAASPRAPGGDAGTTYVAAKGDAAIAISAPSDAASVDAGRTPDAGDVPLQGPTGPSAGCGSAAPSGDSTKAWTKHDLKVDGVAARFLKGGDKYGSQAGYDFSMRNFFVRLPANYDPNKHYPLLISGGGCGATNGTSGNGGGANPLADNQDVAVQVGLSYVYPMGAGACFADETSDTPDLPYFDAVLAQLDKSYCFDRAKVFVSGFSSGAWETYMLGCARAGVIRGIGTQAGGLRKERPTCSKVPLAAFLTAGVNDANPIKDVDSSGFDSGSEAARDVILKTNGCPTTDTTPYVTADAPADWNCVRYTSCPAAYPVIWCAITADGGGHGAGSPKAFFPFWSTLPTH